MPITTTGGELKAFYNDKSVWPPEIWHEDEEVEIDGVMVDRTKDDIDFGVDVADTAKVKISGGFITNSAADELGTFENHFRKWQKVQTTTFISVKVPKDKLDDVVAAIKAAGGIVA